MTSKKKNKSSFSSSVDYTASSFSKNKTSSEASSLSHLPLLISSPSHSTIVLTLQVLEKTRTQKTMLESLPAFTSYQLLVATMLSARTRDATTIPLVKHLFSLYPTPKDVSKLPLKKIEELIYGVGFYHTKSKHLKTLSEIIEEKYGGICPTTFEELTELPGVGRKTANCILNYAFHKPAIAVDIHVHRISNRLGWVTTTTAEETELALQKVVPFNCWKDINKLLVTHGQTICEPRKPKCSICPITMNCTFFNTKTLRM